MLQHGSLGLDCRGTENMLPEIYSVLGQFETNVFEEEEIRGLLVYCQTLLLFQREKC